MVRHNTEDMDCSENESVCSVKKENNLGYYRIHTIWNDSGFRVNIASKDGAWTGEMKPDNVKSISSELKMDPDKYLAECKEVLTTDDGKKGYFYAVENGAFTWKKMIDEDSGMKIRMGSVMVQPVSFVDTVQNIIEVALNCKKTLNEQLNTLRKEKERDLKRITQLQQKLEELCNKKNLMENDLYSKFLLVLNAKKRKIQDLESSASNVKESFEKSENQSKHRKKAKEKEITIIEAYEMDTEDEDDCVITGQIKKGHTSSELCLDKDVDISEDTSDVTVISGNSPIPGTSNTDVNSDNSNTIKDNMNKSIPATKADILDFFFGPND